MPSVAGEAFLRATGARVGDTVTVQADGTPVRLRIVGEVFDTGTAVFTSAPALPQLRPHEYRAGGCVWASAKGFWPDVSLWSW